MSDNSAKFAIGQLIHHTLFDYRGVVVDVDPQFKGSDSWYHNATRSNPPKDQPWYHVLVDGEEYATYVAERNLEPDASHDPVKHPELGVHFDHMEDGIYIRRIKTN